MYLDACVKVPEAPGKITYRTKGRTTYVEFESNRVYNPEKKYTHWRFIKEGMHRRSCSCQIKHF